MPASKAPPNTAEREDTPLLQTQTDPPITTISGYGTVSSGALEQNKLHRGLSARQVQMIAIAGTIGTGLFLGTGRSLAQGGPASVLLSYTIVGFIVYVTLLLLGEMATQYPVAGSFTAYATRFVSPSFGFALSWNYWFNDAVSVASDLTAAQLVMQFWTDWHPWVISLVFFVFLLSLNSFSVNAYGELEYILSSLKVLTIVVFVLIGVFVNVGLNRQHEFVGFRYWSIPGAPFVGGWGGFARVFVTASFAYGGTESLGITAGETRNPSKNMPRVIKFVFWRILIFYVLSIFIIGLNVPYDYPNLSNRTTTTSPFTIVFSETGSTLTASMMNTVILSSVLSAGNHALFAGTRVLYSLASSNPPLAPRVFARTNKAGVPIWALIATSSATVLCFTSSFVGGGVLWGWLQNLVGVSNQIAWFSIGLASWRFRRSWVKQGRSLDEMKFRSKWTWGWGPPFVVVTTVFLVVVQGWPSFIPEFSPVDFLSLYIEVPLMIIMYIIFSLLRPKPTSLLSSTSPTTAPRSQAPLNIKSKIQRTLTNIVDIVNIESIDLYEDEHDETEDDREDDLLRKERLAGRFGWAWRLWYFLA